MTSQMTQLLSTARPDWPGIPPELDRAWSWLENQGYGHTSPAGYFLNVSRSKRGPAFTSELDLTGWFDEGSVGHDHLLPIAEAAGDGSIIALWRDDDRTRVVVLESEGTAFVAADTPADLLTLLAVGYDEVLEMNLGAPPEDPIAEEDLAEFRSWVESELGREVPTLWGPGKDAGFADWLDAALGREPQPPAPPTQPTIAVNGEVATLLGLLGQPDDAAAASTVATLTGATFQGRLSAAEPALLEVGVEMRAERGKITTFWIRLTDRTIGEIVATAAPAYPRPAALIDGLGPDSAMAAAEALFGEPERRGEGWLRYAVGDAYLRLGFQDDQLVKVTVMTQTL